jgi:hypothetical protein
MLAALSDRLKGFFRIFEGETVSDELSGVDFATSYQVNGSTVATGRVSY